MNRIKGFIAVFAVAAVLFAQTGCAFLVKAAAVGVGKEVGKKAYKKLKGDEEKNQQDRDQQDQDQKRNQQDSNQPSKEE